MRADDRKTVSVVGLLALAIISLAPRAIAQDADGDALTLVGTWTVQVTRQDCQTHVPAGPPFLSLLTFNRDGTVTETTSNPQFGLTLRGPGHGVWKRVGGAAFRAYSAAFITANGVLVSTQYIDQQIELTGDDGYVVPSSAVAFVSPAGVTLSAGCAVAIARRLEIK
jgi:hypothetical protein